MTAMQRLTLHINGQDRTVEVPDDTSLLAVLRADLDLTGAKYGCGHGGCGACAVLIDRVAVTACTTRAADAVGKDVVTIEGLARDGALDRVQRAFVDEDAMQCGYCTGGMIIAAEALLATTPSPDEQQIREALAPHLCRCGVYGRAVRAIRRAAR